MFQNFIISNTSEGYIDVGNGYLNKVFQIYNTTNFKKGK